MRQPWKIDVPIAILGSLLAVGLTFGLALGFRAVAGESDAGPTAKTLDDATVAVAGAFLGALIAAALTAFLSRSDSKPVRTALTALALGYLALILPILVVTGPSDVSLAEDLTFALLGLFPWLAVGWIGAVVGQLFRAGRGREDVRIARG